MSENISSQTMRLYTSQLAEALGPDVLDRFLRYTRINTQSATGMDTSPSTENQLDLARLLVDELTALGLTDASVDNNGCVVATLPGNTSGDLPIVGLIAHLDTTPDAPGANVEPIIHRNYQGDRIVLPQNNTILDPQAMPLLIERKGHDIVTSSGDTLLGADDKAGVAEVMAAVTYLVGHPEMPRPTLRIGFTPDEEIGRGGLVFDVEGFRADWAYTFDGSFPGELNYETFTATQAAITIHGVDIHPGYATGKLVNAAKIAAEIVAALPSDRLTPDTTSGREGFIHVVAISGTADKANITAIIRDFEDDLLEQHINLLRDTAERVMSQFPQATMDLALEHQYPNMRHFLKDYPEVIAIAKKAIEQEGLTPVTTAIRGGTDGSLLSSRGLPTPNIFAAQYEIHSVREWTSVQDMAAATAVAVRLVELWAGSD